MHSGIVRARLAGVFLFFLLFLAIILTRLLYLQVIRHNFYFKIANGQHTVSIELPPKRGTIFDRNMRPLAVSLNNDSVFANPREIKNKARFSREVASILNLDEKFIRRRISRDKYFVWIKRKVSPDEAQRIKRLKTPGIGIVEESKRFYPDNSLACHVLGTVDIDNAGLEGLELYYNSYLKGESGWLISTQDGKRKLVESYQGELIAPKNGLNLQLTIDEVIQSVAERELNRICQKYNAKGASIIVMDPRNGDILALANFPDYDLNNAARRSPEAIRNRAINDFFEPGSVFKIVTASAALEEAAADLDDKFYCEDGAYKVGRRILHDHRPHGMLTFRQVIEKSSNIGTVKIAGLFGPNKMYGYIKAFGFFDKTGVDLPGEVVGMNRPPSRWSSVSMLAIPIGQEVTATAMQLACAISVIANNGFLVRPRVVKAIVDEKGHPVKEFQPKALRRVISPQTASKVRGMLMGVVESGTGKKAKIEEYGAAGKTGTAQKVEPSGLYSHERFIASFIGFAPVERPALSIVVCVDEPRPVYYGGEVAAPVFKNVAGEALKYLNAKGSKVL